MEILLIWLEALFLSLLLQLLFTFILQAEFDKFGTVVDVYNTGKGFAFVTFDQQQDAQTVSS